MIEPPAGYAVRSTGSCTLIARPRALPGLKQAGLEDPLEWPPAAAGEAAAGRGAVVRYDLAGVGPVVLKRMHRGGLAAALWRGRFIGAGRLVRNLTVADEAVRRGVPTAAPVALWLRAGPPGLYRSWLAVREISGATDLLTALGSERPPGEPALRGAIAAVRRMHDAGVEHPDLNLGNVLFREGHGEVEGFVVDLDRAVLRSGPLSAGRRRAAMLRLERSHLKSFGREAPPEWRRWYAGGDAALAAVTRPRGPLERLALALRRLRWSMPAARAGARSPVRRTVRRVPRTPDDDHGA